MSPGQEPTAVPRSSDQPRHFNTTHWSVIIAAGDQATLASRAALENLCRAYWRPIYAYVRQRGHRPEEAEDLTQAFFEHVLERKLFSVADRRRGRFRTFLLHCCEYFIAKQWRDQQRLKRGGGQQVFSLDAAPTEEWYQNQPLDLMTPERLYERRWALAVLARVHDRLRQEWANAGKGSQFGALQAYLSGERETTPCAHTALELGMSEGAVRTAVHRLRQRYGQLLREEVAQTISNPDDLEDELRHLMTVL
jgi:RNA polymerase sigma factor (sigma-70 family)